MSIARRLARRLPGPVRTVGVLSLSTLRVLSHVRGRYPRECPVCGHIGRFAMLGDPPRYDARCPGCGSQERHRLIVLAIERRRVLGPHDSVLYFTPEIVLLDYLRARVASVRTWGLAPLESIDAEDGAFDAIIASNTLEHAEDDMLALAELRRVLSDAGWLILTVPLVDGWRFTYDDPAIQSKGERLLHFGERNHLRLYGQDFRDRIGGAGFTVEDHVAGGADSARYALIPGHHVFLARKALA